MSKISHRPLRRLQALPAVITIVVVVSGLLPASARAAWENGTWASIIEPAVRTQQLQSCSDGQGGTLVAAVDSASTPVRVVISRIDHTGNELWGEIGTMIPFEQTAEGQGAPIALAPDGQGGAFCAYGETYGGALYLSVARMDDHGFPIGSRVVAALGTAHPDLAAAAVPTGDGGVIVVWNVNALPDSPLQAARLTADLDIAWQQDTGLFAEVLPFAERWLARADGQGGVLVASTHVPASEEVERRVQRLSGDGLMPWGPAGVNVWNWQDLVGDIVEVVPGAAGDAFAVASRGWGNITLQHLAAANGVTWAAGLEVGQDYYPVPCEPVACTDQAGGVFLVSGYDDPIAYRVDAQGGHVWGAAGVTLTSTDGWQVPTAVTSDGHAGMLVVYEQHYWSLVGDPFAHALGALRLDAFANLLWERETFYMTPDFPGPILRVANPAIVADGSGGGHAVWPQFDDGWNSNVVLAAGLGPDGANPPTPSLTAMWPDAGEPGQTLGILALGDYLDPAFTYALERGVPAEVPITGATVVGGTLLAGFIDLTGADAGAYDLVARSGGAQAAVLLDAFGVGAAPDCGIDRPMSLDNESLTSFGSQRKAAFDTRGRIHYASLGVDASSHEYVVKEWVGGGESGTYTTLYTSREPLRDLAFTLGPGDERHVVFVSAESGSEIIHYIRDGAHFQSVVADGVAAPALALDAAGGAMIVFESGYMGSTALFYMQGDNGGLGPKTDLISGAGAVQPDICADADGFTLLFVRDFWFPGLREVCRQQFRQGSWESPVSLQFGLQITSPSVAWDGGSRTLCAWILDNSGTQPLLHTMLATGGVDGAIRWRPGDGLIYRCSVAASAPGAFRLLTQESVSGIPMAVYLRSGDGQVFQARRRVNGNDDVDFPVLAAERGGPGLFAAWEDYDLPTDLLSYYLCDAPVAEVAPDLPAGAALRAYPNPFNPRTVFTFELKTSAEVRLDVVDVRGRRVRSLHAGPMARGEQSVAWDGTDDHGRRLPSGVYFGRLRQAAGDRTAKVMLLK